MAKDTVHFKVKEFACKCGCGKDDIDQRVIDMAETIRDAIKVPIHVNSGCRCDEYNESPPVGGVKGSYHTLGLAADLSCSLGAKALFVAVVNLKAKGKLPDLQYAIWYGKKNFVHIDCGKVRNNFFEVKP